MQQGMPVSGVCAGTARASFPHDITCGMGVPGDTTCGVALLGDPAARGHEVVVMRPCVSPTGQMGMAIV